MQHYSREQWQQYILGQLEESEAVELEEHLYSCDTCMTTYLSLMEESDLPQGVELSHDFTNGVMREIQFEDTSFKRSNLGRQKRKEIFKYYVIAASITMILMYSGVFNIVATEIPRATNEVVISTKKVEELVPVGWSQKWMDTTLAKLNAITIKQGSDKNEN